MLALTWLRGGDQMRPQGQLLGCLELIHHISSNHTEPGSKFASIISTLLSQETSEVIHDMRQRVGHLILA
jgi:hypothetical protein